MIQNKFSKLSLMLLVCLGAFQASASSYTLSIHNLSATILDSIDNEVSGGQRFVIHKLAAKETYYQLSRIYGVPVKEIMDANGKKSLKIGDTVRIPRGTAVQVTSSPKRETIKLSELIAGATTNGQQQPALFTEYKVGSNETLYAISRRFDITVETLKKANNLTSDTVREGQLLKIPSAEIPEPVSEEPMIAIPEVEETLSAEETAFKANRYGIHEKNEKGVGVLMDNFGDNVTSLALHKSAPVGTILKITNPMNRSVTFAKVVGKFADNQDNEGAIVILSKSVARSVGILDKRFQIELNYGVPIN